MSDPAPTTVATMPGQRIGSLALVWFGGAALLFLVGLTVVGVGFRYVLGNPIFGIEDIAKMTLAIVTASGVALAALSRAHIAVDLFVSLFPPGIRRAVSIIVGTVGMAVCLYTAYALINKGTCGHPCGQFTPNLSITHVPFYLVLGGAFLIYAGVLAYDAVQSLLGRS